MGKHVIETIMGAVVLLVALGFLVFAYNSGTISSSSAKGYQLYASFDRADGINVGSDVRVSGIKVGRVSSQRLDPKTYLAQVFMIIDETVKIPADSTAEITSDGFLGGKYLSIVPGGDDKMLTEGQRIKHTQSSVSLESLIGKFMYGGTGGNKETQEEKKPDAAAPQQETTPETATHKNVLD